MEYMSPLEKVLVTLLALVVFIGYGFMVAYLIACLQHFKWHD